jgi:ATP:corrinoid adenosyltransferase
VELRAEFVLHINQNSAMTPRGHAGKPRGRPLLIVMTDEGEGKSTSALGMLSWIPAQPGIEWE